MAVVGLGGHACWIEGFPEAGPARARFEFIIRLKQRLSAAGTTIDSFLLAVPVCAGEGRLGAFVPQDGLFLGRKPLLPLGVGLGQGRRFLVYCIRHGSVLPLRLSAGAEGYILGYKINQCSRNKSSKKTVAFHFRGAPLTINTIRLYDRRESEGSFLQASLSQVFQQ